MQYDCIHDGKLLHIIFIEPQIWKGKKNHLFTVPPDYSLVSITAFHWTLVSVKTLIGIPTLWSKPFDWMVRIQFTYKFLHININTKSLCLPIKGHYFVFWNKLHSFPLSENIFVYAIVDSFDCFLHIYSPLSHLTTMVIGWSWP